MAPSLDSFMTNPKLARPDNSFNLQTTLEFQGFVKMAWSFILKNNNSFKIFFKVHITKIHMIFWMTPEISLHKIYIFALAIVHSEDLGKTQFRQ